MCLYVVLYAFMIIIYACIMMYVCLITLIAVSLGCLHDDVCAKSGSWLVAGMILVFDKKKSYASLSLSLVCVPPSPVSWGAFRGMEHPHRE